MTRDDFVSLFIGMESELENLEERFPLKDFSLMMTSQRTTQRIYEKISKILQKKTTHLEHGNFWADLRALGLIRQDKNEISDFGKQIYEYFSQQNNDFKREHFMLKHIRKKSFGIPSSVHDKYCEKILNLDRYLAIILETNTECGKLLLNKEKIFFTECLNAFPNALKRYLQLPADRQKNLDGLREFGLTKLFDETSVNQPNMFKIARRFANRDRAHERRINFIKSAILSEYEEKTTQLHHNDLLPKILPKCKEIFDQSILDEIISQSVTIQYVGTDSPKLVSISQKINNLSMRKSNKDVSKVLKEWTPDQIDNILEKYSETMSKETSRDQRLVLQIKRNKTISKILKVKYNYKCQICNIQIRTKVGGYYIESAHIIPLSNDGEDTPDNMIVVCPNHHKMIDYGEFEVIKIKEKEFIFKLYGKIIKIKK